jgi:putative ABC transport system permease protein
MWTGLAKLRAVLARSPDLAEELREEMEAHIDLAVEENIADGMSPDAARLRARRHFGNPTLTAERARQAWSFAAVENTLHDLRFAWRGLFRSPGFSLVVLLTLALGIGANTAVFSVVDAVLLKPLPYPSGERLVRLAESSQKLEGFSVSWLNYQNWRRDNHSFDEMAAYELRHATLTGRGEPSLLRAGVVTSQFFPLLGMRPVLGRLFVQADDQSGAAPNTVVLTTRFWTDKLGHDPNVLNATLTLDGTPYQIIGVASSTLDEFFGKPLDFYFPLAPFHNAELKRSEHGSIRVLGRLKPGVSLAAAKADLDAIMQRLALADPGPENEHRTEVAFLIELRTRSIRATLFILMGAVSLVLAIACANVASLVLARSSARTREFAVRAAIGAGRSRLVRQLLAESILLSVLGGLAGLLLLRWCLRLLIAIGPQDIPRLSETAINSRVLLFAGLIALVTGLLVGLAPVFSTRKLDLVTALNESSHGTTQARSGQSFRSALLVGEIAVTMMLVFASGLLIRSLMVAENSSPNFAPEHLLALELILPSSSYHSGGAIQRFYDGLSQDLRTVPRVDSVGMATCPPSSGGCGDWFYSVSGHPVPAQGDVPVAFVTRAAPGYFKTMKIPLKEGRDFTDADRATSPPVAIVNEVLAREWWPKQSAVGQRIKYGGPYLEGPTLEIIGVAGDVSQIGLDVPAGPEMYLPFAQQPSSAMVVMIRASGDPERLDAMVRRRVAQADRNLPIQSLEAFEKTIAGTLERRRFSTLLLTLFAALAAVLAVVGVYGLLGYWVSVRERDIAIRLALGARPSTILRWLGAQALQLTATGIACGTLAAWAAARWMETLVFGISPRNIATFLIAAAGLASLTIVAAALPIWRAMRVDPVRNLRDA